MTDATEPPKPVRTWPTISHSGAWMMGQCERQWAFRYRDRLKAEPSRAMAKGLFLHRCLGALHTGTPWQEEALQIVREWHGEHPGSVDAESGEVDRLAEPDWMVDMSWLMERYEAHWGPTLREFEVLAVEKEFKIRLPHKYAWLTGRIDMVIRDTKGHVWIVDWKSTSKFDGFEQYCWAPQLSLYYYAGQELGYEPWGLIVDGLNTYRWVKDRPLADSFQRRYLDRSPAQTAVAVAEATAAMVRGRQILRGAYPIRNVDRHCGWCPYREPCREELAFAVMTVAWDDE